jgi:hypothetical protein
MAGLGELGTEIGNRRRLLKLSQTELARRAYISRATLEAMEVCAYFLRRLHTRFGTRIPHSDSNQSTCAWSRQCLRSSIKSSASSIPMDSLSSDSGIGLNARCSAGRLA